MKKSSFLPSIVRRPVTASAFIATLILPQAALSAPPVAIQKQVQQKVDLVPYRAVYDLAMDESRPGSGVGNVLGRLVMEFTGSDCHGYTLNTRLVTQVTDRKGNATTSDLRSSTFEEGRGRAFRFATTQYLGEKISEITFGEANRQSGKGVDVRLKRPKDIAMHITPDVLFPTQHSREILKAALAGKSLLEANIYDGSDEGDKVYLTSTFIGALRMPREQQISADGNAGVAAKPDVRKLDGLKSWPVIISYYNQDDASDTAGEGVPDYELAYILYSNGISRKLMIDYGDFSINGVLADLKLLPAAACN